MLLLYLTTVKVCLLVKINCLDFCGIYLEKIASKEVPLVENCDSFIFQSVCND